MGDDERVDENSLSNKLKCDTCFCNLKRCVVYPCRNILYDYDDPFRHAHLCGLCSTCGKIKEIYFSSDPRVYFPPEYIFRLELYNSTNTINLEHRCYVGKSIC